MKKTLIIILLAITATATAQTRESGTNIEVGAGVNDMGCISPVIGLGIPFTTWLAWNTRFTYADGEIPGIEFTDYNIESYANIAPVYFGNRLKKHLVINVNLGVIAKIQDFHGFKPTPKTHLINVGLIAGVELEYAVNDYWSLFCSPTYRTLFVDERQRHELFYSIGTRISLKILSLPRNELQKNYF
ncbi:MAG: hypothetical protein LBT48_01490 [Prevotellaceae bacterium]|jgi:hypothetical protein|nr:hypothetical protein [Prevotellaceae bacterium]